MTKRLPLLCLFILALSLPAAASEPGSIEHLYQEHCIACHGSEVYTRRDRKVTSAEGLKVQVQRCELSLGLRWFDEEITGMADYLNENYYQFTP
jgi:hypothetical protein